MKSLGQTIRELRRQAELTQVALAKKVGITGAAISQLEKGMIGAQPSVLNKLSAVLACDLTTLPIEAGAPVVRDGFGGRMEAARVAKNLSQARLASLVGISRASVSLYETGGGNPSTQVLKQLAFFLDISVDHLLNEPQPEAPAAPQGSLVVSAAPMLPGEGRWVCKGCGKALAYSEPIELGLMLNLLRVFMDGHAQCASGKEVARG
jgi:transcriptional regulator with XRE-family HTH domain